jgi:hypothetical protein
LLSFIDIKPEACLFPKENGHALHLQKQFTKKIVIVVNANEIVCCTLLSFKKVLNTKLIYLPYGV